MKNAFLRGFEYICKVFFIYKLLLIIVSANSLLLNSFHITLKSIKISMVHSMCEFYKNVIEILF